MITVLFNHFSEGDREKKKREGKRMSVRKKNGSNQLLRERGQMFAVSIIELFQSDKQRCVLCN